VVAPPATLTVDGTLTRVPLAARPIVNPAEGAALLRVIVPAELAPLTTLAGFSVMPETVGAVTVSAAWADDPLTEAVMAPVAFAATATVLTEKVPVVAPAAIDTVVLPGVAAELVLARLTVSPPVGATLLIVTHDTEIAARFQRVINCQDFSAERAG